MCKIQAMSDKTFVPFLLQLLVDGSFEKLKQISVQHNNW